MRSIKVLLCVLPLLLLASACMPQITLRSELFLDDRSLVTGDPCGAPCWNDIIPGETSWTAALEAIQNDAHFSNVEVSTEGEAVAAVWQKADSGQTCCQLVGNSAEDSVESVYLMLSPQTVVDELLEAHGEPTYVVVQQVTDIEFVAWLIYPDVPMLVGVLLGDASSSLLANSEVVVLSYMTPEQMDSIIAITDGLKGWNGYQSYAAYLEATAIVTPSVTVTPTPEG